ncbi:MAG: MerR family transcriptional regulator [Nocardioides sp.]|uniref:heat shock protein transcriptional repressor HspR n=1 Tax=Nocardioides sp. TaxID=35761 RepID=UPI0039E64149
MAGDVNRRRGSRGGASPAHAAPAPEAAVYVISVAAELTGLHPQTLRTYERMGLITPGRTGGGGRRYSHRDIELLRSIAELTASGIGIEGVRRILELEHQVAALRARNEELQAEVAAAKEALRQGRRQPSPPAAPVQASRLPAVRAPDPGSSMVIWRRGR